MSWVERVYAGARRPGVPRPFVMVIFEWQTLGFEVGIYTPAVEGSLVYAGVDLVLPGPVADALVVVWPSRETTRANRRASLLRLLGRAP